MENWHKSSTRKDYLTRSVGDETWRVSKHSDGWYWRSAIKGTSRNLTHEIGPFATYDEAILDCETRKGKEVDA